MAWLYLLAAGLCEWGWPVGLKLGLGNDGWHPGWISFAALCMIASGTLLLLAERSIPIGTAYAVWTGIGAAGAFVLGIALFGEVASAARFFFVGLILIGIIGLKLTTDLNDGGS